ncbi:hypothetical protein C2845_PM01G38740 [Panicum miliaceum]|uniref:Uncharacterized protein n=1 Tax=Panicum miliaceum TaxID=4540 RepID=A0A3L6TWD5_PANMI|nr:hypothetical protein C2845_PM01G38740 [Panicum miliaceum]
MLQRVRDRRNGSLRTRRRPLNRAEVAASATPPPWRGPRAINSLALGERREGSSAPSRRGRAAPPRLAAPAPSRRVPRRRRRRSSVAAPRAGGRAAARSSTVEGGGAGGWPASAAPPCPAPIRRPWPPRRPPLPPPWEGAEGRRPQLHRALRGSGGHGRRAGLRYRRHGRGRRADGRSSTVPCADPAAMAAEQTSPSREGGTCEEGGGRGGEEREEGRR